jgi:hypothetical protein
MTTNHWPCTCEFPIVSLVFKIGLGFDQLGKYSHFVNMYQICLQNKNKNKMNMKTKPKNCQPKKASSSSVAHIPMINYIST